MPGSGTENLETKTKSTLEVKDPKSKQKVQTIVEIFNKIHEKRKHSFTPRKSINCNPPISPASKVVFKTKFKAHPSSSPANSSISMKAKCKKHSSTQLVPKPKNSQQPGPTLARQETIKSYFQTISQPVIITPNLESKSCKIPQAEQPNSAKIKLIITQSSPAQKK